MKKLLSTIVLCCAMATAGAQQTGYKITGTVPDGVKEVTLYNATTHKPIGSAPVKDGKFVLEGKGQHNEILTLAIGREGINLFNDGTPVDLDIKGNALEASELNKKLRGCERELDKYGNKIGEKYELYEEAVKDKSEAGKAKAKLIESEIDALQDSLMAKQLGFVADNKDNIIPAFLIGTMYYMLPYDELKTMLDPSAAYFSHPALKPAKAQLAALEKRKPGKMFMDLAMNDLDGKPRKLSEWCGKGNYVLIDFWASWCGPCRQEMPNVVENYNKYHSKGFEVIGVSFDNNASAWKTAVKSLGMAWPQLSDLKAWKSAAAPLYGIMAIPSNVLVDKDGKIVATDLRGSNLGKTLKEIYGF